MANSVRDYLHGIGIRLYKRARGYFTQSIKVRFDLSSNFQSTNYGRLAWKEETRHLNTALGFLPSLGLTRPGNPLGWPLTPACHSPRNAHTHAHGHAGERGRIWGGGGKGSTGLPSPTASGCRGGEEARPTGSGPRIKSRIITVLIKIKGRRERTHSIKENGKNGSGGEEMPPEAVVPSTHPTTAVGVPGLRPPLLSPHSGTPGTARPLRTAPHRTAPRWASAPALAPAHTLVHAHGAPPTPPPPPRAHPRSSPPPSTPGVGEAAGKPNGKNNTNKSLSLSLKRRYGAVRWESGAPCGLQKSPPTPSPRHEGLSLPRTAKNVALTLYYSE